MLTSFDKDLLNLLQTNLPIDKRPFAVLAALPPVRRFASVDKARRRPSKKCVATGASPPFSTPVFATSSSETKAKVSTRAFHTQRISLPKIEEKRVRLPMKNPIQKRIEPPKK